MIKTVIFDMDGVLVNSEPLHHEVSLVQFKELNIEVTNDIFATFTGNSNKMIYQKIKEKFQLEHEIEDLIAAKNKLFIEVLMSTGMLGMALFINYYKFVAQSFIKVLKHIDKYKESGVIIFFFLQYFILSQTSGNIYSSFECWYFGAVVIGLGYINFTNEEIKSNDSRGHTAGNH